MKLLRLTPIVLLLSVLGGARGRADLVFAPWSLGFQLSNINAPYAPFVNPCGAEYRVERLPAWAEGRYDLSWSDMDDSASFRVFLQCYGENTSMPHLEYVAWQRFDLTPTVDLIATIDVECDYYIAFDGASVDLWMTVDEYATAEPEIVIGQSHADFVMYSPRQGRFAFLDKARLIRNRRNVLGTDLRYLGTSAPAGQRLFEGAATINITLNPAPSYSKADLNCDGQVDGNDVGPFVQCLLEPWRYRRHYPTCTDETADINGDGAVDVYDIEPFVAQLLGA